MINFYDYVDELYEKNFNKSLDEVEFMLSVHPGFLTKDVKTIMKTFRSGGSFAYGDEEEDEFEEDLQKSSAYDLLVDFDVALDFTAALYKLREQFRQSAPVKTLSELLSFINLHGTESMYVRVDDHAAQNTKFEQMAQMFYMSTVQHPQAYDLIFKSYDFINNEEDLNLINYILFQDRNSVKEFFDDAGEVFTRWDSVSPDKILRIMDSIRSESPAYFCHELMEYYTHLSMRL